MYEIRMPRNFLKVQFTNAINQGTINTPKTLISRNWSVPIT